MRQFGSIPTPADAEEINWNELSPEEQASLIRQGYRPPTGSILHGNLDLELRELHQGIANGARLPLTFLFPQYKE